MSASRIIASQIYKMVSPALIVPAVKKHTATVIMAHGLGDRYGYSRIGMARRQG